MTRTHRKTRTWTPFLLPFVTKSNDLLPVVTNVCLTVFKIHFENIFPSTFMFFPRLWVALSTVILLEFSSFSPIISLFIIFNRMSKWCLISRHHHLSYFSAFQFLKFRFFRICKMDVCYTLLIL